MSVVEHWLVLPFDLDVAYVHARLESELVAHGQRIGFCDLIIAATAIVNQCEVITHNMREFQRVPGLTVRSIDW
jgi:predicted nucleic acid-binding protein